MGDWRCEYCDQSIGVYERMTVLEALGYRQTSRAAEPELTYVAGTRFHSSCHARAREKLLGTSELNVSQAA